MRVAPESESRVHTELFPKSTFYRHLRRAGPFIFAVVIISAVIAVGAVTIDRLSEAASKQTAESRLKDLEETIANLFQQSLISTNQQMHGYASGICELIDASRNGEEVSARAVRDVYKTMQRSAGGNERQQRHFPETMYAVAVRPWERAGFESWASLAFDQPMNISTPKMVNGQVRGFMPAPETPSNSLDLHFPILFVGEENAPPFALKQGYLVDMVSFGPSSSTSQSWIETVRTGHAAYFVLRALVSTGYKARGTRVVWPLYNCSNPFYVPDTEEERVAQIIGMAGRSVYTDSLLADVFAQHDILQPGSEEHEYVSASMSIQNVTIYSSHDDPFQNVVLSYSSNFLLDNTTEFQVTLEASQGFVEQYRPDSRWLLTAICLVATLVGIFVFGVSSLWLNHATSVEERQQKGIQQRLDTLHELIYTTSHDLRTPIMAIRGAISMLEPQLPKNTPAESSTKGSWTPLELAISATKLLELFVENLQDTAKIQQGGLDLQSQSVDLVHEFSTLVSLVKATVLLQQETSLSFECSERTPQDTRVLCDRGRVVRVVMNLVSNACKFTRTGTIKVFMDMSRSTAPVAHEVQPEWQVRISVSDTGVGMDGPMLERAMKPFVRAAAKEGGGTGLGLHICNETARAYNGTMTMDSPGKGLGSTVTVNLRLQQAPAEPPPTVMPVEETPSRSSANADLSVLIVEDNFVVSKVLQAMLNRLGVVNVELAGDGGVAQRLLETTDRGYDCCFMDDSMPVMCGTDLIRSVRKWEHSNRAARLPTCLLTGSLLDSRTTVTDEAFDYLITKPPSLSSLKAFLQTARDLRGGHRSQNPTPPNPPSSGTLPPVRRFRAPE